MGDVWWRVSVQVRGIVIRECVKMSFFDTLEFERFFRVAGLFGFFVYMASFAALQFKLLDGQSLIYTGLNVLAASLVLVSLMVDFNLSSALIQISWITIGCAGFLFRFTQARPKDEVTCKRHFAMTVIE